MSTLYEVCRKMTVQIDTSVFSLQTKGDYQPPNVQDWHLWQKDAGVMEVYT